MLAATAALRLHSCSAAEGCSSLRSSLAGLLGMCSLATRQVVPVPDAAPVPECITVSIGSDQASVYREYVGRVAPDLLDKAKSFNLIAAVMRKFAPNTNAQGPPKAKSNAAKTVFNFHLPDIGWVDYSDCQRPKGRDLTATGSEPGEVVLQPPTQSFAASTEGPRRSQISQQPLRTIEVHADSAQTATETFLYSLLHDWTEAGLLLATRGTLAIPPCVQPLPVRVPRSDCSPPVFYQAHVDDAQLSAMAQRSWSGRTHVISSRGEAQDAVSGILKRAAEHQRRGSPGGGGLGALQERVVGFDIEFKPRWNASLPESPPTVIQVATSTEVYVFHVKHFARGVRVGAAMEVIERALEPLSPLFASSAVFKVGVGVLGDVSLLQKFSRTLTCRGFHDMSPVATSAGFKRHSLKALSGLLLGHSISKKQQKSNWDKFQLTSAQVAYAATDAWVSREIALKLAPLWLSDAAAAS